MARVYPHLTAATILLAILLALSPAAAAELPDYTIAYTITVKEDGSALWQVEYRTLLATDEDATAFEAYAATIDTEGLTRFRQLIERSASQAAVANSRHMEVTDFKGTADIQTSPTGRFGIVLYSFVWEGFASGGQDLEIGDAFAGGLYLPGDSTLTLRYPAGYTVQEVQPAPDRTSDGLTWSGVRSFGIGKPQVVIRKDTIPLVPAIAAIVLIVLITAGALFLSRRRTVQQQDDSGELAAPDDPEQPPAALSAAEIHSLEEQITLAIRSSGGEMYQSEIVRTLGLPKSTVSCALNEMHARGRIVKVKKGRENLIRLA